MPAATRLLVAFLVLIAAFVALVGVAVFSLFVAWQQVLAGVVATAGLVGLAAGGCTWWLLRREVAEEEEIEAEPERLLPDPPPRMPPTIRRGPLRVQSMPVANLPPAYLDAVMRGAQARLTAMKAQAGAGHGAESR